MGPAALIKTCMSSMIQRRSEEPPQPAKHGETTTHVYHIKRKSYDDKPCKPHLLALPAQILAPNHVGPKHQNTAVTMTAPSKAEAAARSSFNLPLEGSERVLEIGKVLRGSRDFKLEIVD